MSDKKTKRLQNFGFTLICVSILSLCGCNENNQKNQTQTQANTNSSQIAATNNRNGSMNKPNANPASNLSMAENRTSKLDNTAARTPETLEKSDKSSEVSQEAVDFAIKFWQQNCKRKIINLECKDFKLIESEPGKLTTADKENGATEKWDILIGYIARLKDPVGKWSDSAEQWITVSKVNNVWESNIPLPPE